MAHSALRLRLRRSLPITATLRRSLSSLVPALSSPPLLKPSISFSSPSSQQQSSSFLASVVQSRLFRSYPAVSLSSDKTYHLYKEGDEITPDTILFEGCDYNHWVILMDFPKDSKLTPEEMVKTYEETCAKGLNISLEEAKQKIYACSTTTYQGFQAVMTEQESEKFHGLPGVVFVLPDSYIDPEKKEYAGDEYINGKIIPRQHRIQRNTEGRLPDQNKNPDRPPRNYQQGGPMQNQQNYPQNNLRQGDDKNHEAPQNYSPQQNYPPQQNFPPLQNYPPRRNFGTPGQGERGGPMPMNPNRRESFQGDRRGLLPLHPRNYDQAEQGNYYPSQGNQSSYRERNFAGNNSHYAPLSHDETYGQGTSSNYGPSYGGQGEYARFSPMEQKIVQGVQRNYAPVGQTGTNQGERGNYYPPQGDQNGYGERNFAGNYSNYTLPSHGGTSSYYGQSYGGQGENQRFSPMERGNIHQGERGNYFPPQGNQSGYGERNFVGNYSNYALPSHGGTYGQGTSSNYGQSYGWQGENQRFSPMERGNIHQGERGNYFPPQGNQSSYGERNFVGNYSNYALPSHGGTYGQGTSSNYGQSYGGQEENHRFLPMEQGNVQGVPRNYSPMGQTVTNQGERGNYYPPQGNRSGYGERSFVGNYSNYAPPSHYGIYGQGTCPNWGHSYEGPGGNQRFSPMEQRNVQGELRNYAPVGQTWTNQGRY